MCTKPSIVVAGGEVIVAGTIAYRSCAAPECWQFAAGRPHLDWLRLRDRDGPRQAATALVLDSDGLSKAAAGDPRAVAWVARARELRLPLVVNAVTLTETLRGGGPDARIRLLTKNAHVDNVGPDLASEAGRLLGRTNRSDTVNALVATTAIRLRQPTVILTSDPQDLEALTIDAPLVRIVAV